MFLRKYEYVYFYKYREGNDEGEYIVGTGNAGDGWVFEELKIMEMPCKCAPAFFSSPLRI